MTGHPTVDPTGSSRSEAPLPPGAWSRQMGDGGSVRSQATIPAFQRAFEEGTLTSERLVQLYLDRIEAYDQQGPNVNAVITLNPDWRAAARELDEERRQSGARSLLHGVPVVLKDTIDVKGMPTTGGFTLLKGSYPARDAAVTRKLKEGRGARAGEGQRQRLVRQRAHERQHPGWPDPQPTQSGVHLGRIELRDGGGGGRELRSTRHRHRYQRLGLDARRPQRPVRHDSVARPDQPRRAHGGVADARSGRRHGALGVRPGRHSLLPHRLGPGGSDHQRVAGVFPAGTLRGAALRAAAWGRFGWAC